jgi:thiamine biosynthesis lipoprotein
MERKTRRVLTGLVFLLTSLSSCSSNYQEDTIYNVFDSYLTTRFYGGGDIQALEDAYRLLSNKLDAYTALDSVNLLTLNSTNEAVDFADDGEMAALLQDCLAYQKKTDGAFNIFTGHLNALWKEALANKTLPDPTALEEAVKESNDTASNYLSFEGSKVTRHGSATLDLGAIGKGYALKKIKEKSLASQKAYFVDAGSSSILLGEKSGGGAFSVGLKDVKNAYLSLKDTALGTSSVSEQNMALEGVTYSHIVNPKTGSAASSLVMAMALGEDPELLDVLSTSFMVVGAGRIEKMAASFGVDYLYYDGTSVFHSSSLEVFYH